ncbi:glycosyltransferase [Paenibacillus sp. NPDC093718]|uniref:glycosyltransferase n=1 Tax=Paenibacillus sp. NPDC093718 TaxID=3390601 RepID=UPI003D00521A
MKHQTISLCMIVKDEERTLERCLNSVLDVVDEIVIVDTGSTDRTIEIARRFTFNIYNFTWTNNFSDARNFAVERATGDYILSLDADEYFGDDSKKILLNPLEASYYFLRIRNMIRSGIVDTHSFARLFKRDAGFLYEGALHEQINFWDLPELKGQVLPVYINHDGYTKAVIKSKDKNERNMQILKEELKQEPTAFGYFNLGTQYKAVGEMENAVQAFQKSYALNPNTTFAPKLLVFLIQSLSNLGRYEDALKVAKDASLLYPTYTDICYEIGLQYKRILHWKDAEASFLECLKLGEVDDYLLSSLEGVGSYIAHAHLAEIYLELGQREQTHKHITQSLMQNKMHFASLRIYLELFVNAPHEDLLRQLQGIYTLDSSEEAMLLMQSLYLLRSSLLPVLSKNIRQEMTTELQAVVLQMEGDFEASRKLWLSCDKISGGSQRDLLLHAIVTEDKEFFKHFEMEFNLRSRDKTLFLKMMNREKISEADITKDINEYFINLCFDLLMQRRYEVIEYFMNQVQVPMLRYELAKMLHKFQFSELALSCILEPDKSIDKDKVYLLAGDILRDLNMHGDAYTYYTQASISSSKFEGLYKIYDLAVAVGDEEIQQQTLVSMANLKPESAWVKQIVHKSMQEAK